MNDSQGNSEYSLEVAPPVPGSTEVRDHNSIEIDGMILGGARRIRYVVESSVTSIFIWTVTLIIELLIPIILAVIIYHVNKIECQNVLHKRRQEFVIFFLAFYTTLSFSLSLTNKISRRSSKECLYFVIMVASATTHVVGMHKWFNLYKDLQETEVKEDEPTLITVMYGIFWL